MKSDRELNKEPNMKLDEKLDKESDMKLDEKLMRRDLLSLLACYGA